MAILYFYLKLSCICYCLLHIYIKSDIFLLIPFSTIDNLSISVKRCNFTLVFSEAAYHGNAGPERNFARSSSYILIPIFLKVLNTSANNNVLL